jgi:hypothetical protein
MAKELSSSEKDTIDNDTDRDIHTLQRNIKNLSCRTHSKLAVSCLTPSGILKSLYRDGRWVACDLEARNFVECMSVFYSVTQRQEKLDALHAQRDKEKQEFRDNHVWTFRTEPPKMFAKFDPEYKHLFTEDKKETDSIEYS